MFKISTFTNFKAFFLAELRDPSQKLKKKNVQGFHRIPLYCVGYGFFSVAVAASLFICFCFLLALY